jgi:thiol-disulfide isomerase/thioredoxin
MVTKRAAYGAESLSSERRWHSRPATRSVVLVALLTVLGLAGCAGSARTVGSSNAAPTTGLSSPLANIGPLPSTLGGGRFDPAVLAGKPVVLWFWAPWCSVCRSEGPTIAKVASQFTGRVRFIGVAGEDTVAAMRAFVQQTGTGALTHLADVNGVVWRDYGVSVQPAFALISADGTANLRIGSLDEQTLRARVAELAAGTRTSSVTMTPGLYCSRAPDGWTVCGASGPPHTSTNAHPLTGSLPGVYPGR